MADIVTDAVAHPEQIDDWLPPHFAKVRWSTTTVLRCPAPKDEDVLSVQSHFQEISHFSCLFMP